MHASILKRYSFLVLVNKVYHLLEHESVALDSTMGTVSYCTGHVSGSPVGSRVGSSVGLTTSVNKAGMVVWICQV